MFLYVFVFFLPSIISRNSLFPVFLATHRLVVTATDRGSPRLAGSATLTVIIVDQNDNSPTIPLPQEVRIPESKGVIITIIILSSYAFCLNDSAAIDIFLLNLSLRYADWNRDHSCDR